MTKINSSLIVNGDQNQSALSIVGSGTASPIFTTKGSSGDLFSVNDSFIGSLFAVNDISGLPILEVFSDNTILTGSFVSPALNTTIKKIASPGTTTIYSIAMSQYTGAFFDYTATDGTNFKAGSIIAVWNGASASSQETINNFASIGTITDITLSVNASGATASFTCTTISNTWTVKTMIRAI